MRAEPTPHHKNWRLLEALLEAAAFVSRLETMRNTKKRDPTFLTYARACQLREMPSHFSGVQMMMSAASRARRSGV